MYMTEKQISLRTLIFNQKSSNLEESVYAAWSIRPPNLSSMDIAALEL